MKLILEKSQEAISLEAYLATQEVGILLDYTTLSTVAGADVRTKARSALTTARKNVLRDRQMVFESVRGMGIKRCNDHDLVAIGTTSLRRIHNVARRGIAKQSTLANFVDLTNADKVKFNTAMSLLGVFYEISKARSQSRIEAAVSVLQKRLPVMETLKAFGVHVES